ncbi:MAG: metal-dependent hydrolase [Gemmatimonadaceae bacterium]
MDNVTHALAGCLLAEATTVFLEKRGVTVTRRVRSALFAVGIISAELPDTDLLYAGNVLGMGKLGYMLHHRGYTHTVVFAIVGALLVWWAALALRKELRDGSLKGTILTLALVGTFSHLALDYSNSYGVHPFWPMSGQWYYGDAVFIIEPWLMIAVLPPLLLLVRGKVGKSIYGVTLAAVILATWMIGFVERDVAIAITVATPIWFVATRFARPSRQVAMALLAWLAVEGVFFQAASLARKDVIASVNVGGLRDIVLTPAVGNPLCFNALVVEKSADVIAATTAAVAPFPSIRNVLRCNLPASVDLNSTEVFDATSQAIAHRTSLEVAWGTQRRGSLVALIALIQENCEISAAMNFVRVPAWRAMQGGATQFSDLRYGEGGFASITTLARPERCPRFVPHWIPPRLDLFTH